jgi:hypothetical protein
MMRLRSIFAGGAIILAAGAAAIVGYASMQASPQAARPAVATATAEVTRGNLRDTKTLTGTLSYGDLSALRPSLDSSSAMVTWIAPVGSTVARGEPLYAIDGEPTILLYGSIPQHRTLRFDPNASTPIWVELETARIDLEAAELALALEEERLEDAEARAADATIRLGDAQSAAPATAEFIQLSEAISAAADKLGRVKELSAAQLAPTADLASAEAGLSAARANLDAAIRAVRRDLASAGLDAATARLAIAQAKVKRDELASTLDELVPHASDTADITQLADNLAALGYGGPFAEQVRAWQKASGLPATGIIGPSQIVVAAGALHIATHTASVGESLSASSPDRGSILESSSTEKLVTIPLNVGDQALAAVGRKVTITLPDDTQIEGTISEVGSVVTEGAIEVTIAVVDQTALSDLEVASVDVEFVSDSRDDVLSVPIAALLARPEGGFSIEVVSGDVRHVTPVETGLFASGRVEISGDGIAEGTLVGVPG